MKWWHLEFEDWAYHNRGEINYLVLFRYKRNIMGKMLGSCQTDTVKLNFNEWSKKGVVTNENWWDWSHRDESLCAKYSFSVEIHINQTFNYGPATYLGSTQHIHASSTEKTQLMIFWRRNNNSFDILWVFFALPLNYLQKYHRFRCYFSRGTLDMNVLSST